MKEWKGARNPGTCPRPCPPTCLQLVLTWICQLIGHSCLTEADSWNNYSLHFLFQFQNQSHLVVVMDIWKFLEEHIRLWHFTKILRFLFPGFLLSGHPLFYTRYRAVDLDGNSLTILSLESAEDSVSVLTWISHSHTQQLMRRNHSCAINEASQKHPVVHVSGLSKPNGSPKARIPEEDYTDKAWKYNNTYRCRLASDMNSWDRTLPIRKVLHIRALIIALYTQLSRVSLLFGWTPLVFSTCLNLDESSRTSCSLFWVFWCVRACEKCSRRWERVPVPIPATRSTIRLRGTITILILCDQKRCDGDLASRKGP